MDHTIICGNIIIDKKEVLMVQEKKKRAYKQWNLPTGKLETSESLTECAAREAKEEAGVDVKPEKLVGIYKKPGEKSDIVLAIMFKSSINSRKLNPDENEVLKARWIPLEKVEEHNLRSSHISKCIEDCLRGNRYSLESIENLSKL